MTLNADMYPPPRVGPGDWLDDELLGRVQVGGYHSGPIPWPYRRRTGAHSLILTATLVRAVRVEAAMDVAEAFGVHPARVSAWRRAFGVDRQNNPGTQRLYRELQPLKLTPERVAKGRQAALQPDAIARKRESIAAGMATRKVHPEKIRWTAMTDALLGTMPDEQASAALGISKINISLRRRYLGKPSYMQGQRLSWTPEMDAQLGTAFDGDLAKQWGICRSSVTYRRAVLGVPAYRTSR